MLVASARDKPWRFDVGAVEQLLIVTGKPLQNVSQNLSVTKKAYRQLEKHH